jgi:phage major head subunit gpT-like protein
MTISGNVPTHLVVGARTGFLNTIKAPNLPWRRIAMEFPMGNKSVDLVDLGATPMPTRSRGRLQVQDYIERTINIKPLDWDITISLSYNAIQDDQTGALKRLQTNAAQVGVNFNKHMNKLVFQAIENGDVAGNICYDGLTFFNSSHIDKGADYQTAQDNVDANALTLDAFTTELVKAQAYRDDRGEFTEYNYDLLVVSPTLEYTAAQICGNAQAYDTSSREANPYSGKFSYIVSPHLNTTAYAIVASNEAIKPVILAMRESPGLQDAWFDPNGPDGGLYYFKYYARYTVTYGDWRLAIMGNS